MHFEMNAETQRRRDAEKKGTIRRLDMPYDEEEPPYVEPDVTRDCGCV